MTTYLAIDLGTTGCRSILYDASLRELAISYEEYPLQTPQEHWAEQDAEDWWRLTCSTARDVIRQAGCSAAEVRALSISSQGITLVPVDTELQPLCPAMTWLDVRAQEQTGQILRDFGDTAIFAHTGKHIDACYTLPKILWLRENRPEIWEKTYKLLMPMDYLLAKLTGRCVTDHSMASGTLLYDLKNACWSRRLLEHYQIPSHLLPEILWSGEAAGRILPEAAAALGVSEDCIVAVGAQDQKCAALGAGLDQDTMTVSLGTAGAVTRLWQEALPERYTSVGWCGYTGPGAWVTEGVINTAGTCLRWVRDTLFPGESYDTINREAEQAAALRFLPGQQREHGQRKRSRRIPAETHICRRTLCGTVTGGTGKLNESSGQRRQYAVHRKREARAGARHCLGRRTWNRRWPDRLVRTGAKLRDSAAGGVY